MKVLVVYCAIGLEGWRGEPFNQGVGSIIAVLKQNDHTVDGFTLTNQKDVLDLYESIESKQYDVIGFSATTNQFDYLKTIIPQIKRNTPQSMLVCGGIHPTMKPDCICEIPELDLLVRGEGEYAMLDIVEAVAGGRDCREILNVTYKKGDEVVHNQVRPLIRDLDLLPYPDMQWVSERFGSAPRNGLNTFMFSRGCAFECTYCSIKALNSLYQGRHNYFRQRSPVSSIAEIELRLKKFSLDYLRFDDNILNANKGWAREFLSLYKERIRLPFQCNLRAGVVDSEIVTMLKDAGCCSVIIGVEHGNEQYRKSVLNRHMTNAEILDSFSYFSDGHISCGAQLLVGLPYENRKLFLDTVRLCRKLPLQTHTLSIFSPYPGTDLYQVCQENNWLPEAHGARERLEAIMDYPGFSRSDIQLCYDVFPYLIKYRNIPLNIPLEWIIKLVKLLRIDMP